MKWLNRIVQALARMLRDELSGPPNIREAARQMLSGLEQHRTAASLAMALAEEARERLQEAIEEHEALERQAADFLRSGDEAAARRLVERQLEAAEEVKRRSKRYEDLQGEADRAVGNFTTEQKGVQTRLAELPQVEDDARLNAERERIDALTRVSLENPTQAFDAAAREMRIRRRQLDARATLAADPNAAIDARISETVADKKLDDAMEALRRRVHRDDGVVDAEFSEVPNPVNDARRLLEAPRYQGLTLASRGAPLRVARSRR